MFNRTHRLTSAGLVKLLVLAGLPLALTLGPPAGLPESGATAPTR